MKREWGCSESSRADESLNHCLAALLVWMLRLSSTTASRWLGYSLTIKELYSKVVDGEIKKGASFQ